MQAFSWVGSSNSYVDEIKVAIMKQRVTYGLFGGNSAAGQYKNEDGCLIWLDDKGEWEFAIVLDAHYSAESAELVIAIIQENKEQIEEVLFLPIQDVFHTLSQTILTIFQSPSFLKRCQGTKGETACLIACRKGNYLWWFNIGDCALFLHHPELINLGEYQQNHRSFFEWIGKESAFHKGVPCYSTGVKELRKGTNHILLTTDGLLECPDSNYSEAAFIFEKFKKVDCYGGILALLTDIQQKNVRDSTTIVSWAVEINDIGTIPSDLHIAGEMR